ncbi:hypothetical protein IE81DRAFT_173399 [Ceraceosorus guamensis]|uniref:Uncharacterized protein n=1 Tax=Ceraceosorus guamensis TaxID=1522189 RepID=A0A316VYJ8_9BASI|nr:hypothetical protein IE81DRAFT_173399 [Ceraceosorus guamensis]PWN41473.1 hypothetical protein IE81DRAFT_173399 [Ceraceosorus guamensis]
MRPFRTTRQLAWIMLLATIIQACSALPALMRRQEVLLIGNAGLHERSAGQSLVVLPKLGSVLGHASSTFDPPPALAFAPRKRSLVQLLELTPLQGIVSAFHPHAPSETADRVLDGLVRCSMISSGMHRRSLPCKGAQVSLNSLVGTTPAGDAASGAKTRHNGWETHTERERE